MNWKKISSEIETITQMSFEFGERARQFPMLRQQILKQLRIAVAEKRELLDLLLVQ